MKKNSVSLLILLGIILISMPIFTSQYDEQVVHTEDVPSEEYDLCDMVRKKQRLKKLCNLIVSNCLSAGSLCVDNNLVIHGDLTIDDLIINTDTTCTITGGLDGQALIGSTGNSAVFQYLTSLDNSIAFTPGPGSLDLEAVPAFGNIARVDQIFGNDTGAKAGAVNGPAFLTIGAALTAAGAYATSSAPVIVWVFPGVYNEAITIPNNVSLVGISSGPTTDVGGVTIQGAVGTTTLVTMGQNSLLANVTLALSSNTDVALTGILIASGPASIDSVRLTVSNTSGGTANVYGIHGTGSGVTSAINRAAIVVSSTGTQSTRGMIFDTTHINMMSNSSITVTSSAGSAIGVETDDGSSSTINASTISGATADILQNFYTAITLEGTTLINSTASGQTFTSTFSPATFVWACLNPVAGVTIPASTFYMIPGTATNTTLAAGSANFGYIVTQPVVVRNLYILAGIAPGSGRTATFTLFKNGVATLLSASITGTGGKRTASDTIHSVQCAVGDVLSMQLVNTSAGTSNLASVSANVELY